MFTAHPTFALSNPAYAALAQCASTEMPPEKAPFFETHRRAAPPTLEEEFTLAAQAITRARDAIDLLCAALLETAEANWPEQWRTLIPVPGYRHKLGWVRHGRSHGYRLVGHAAPTAAHEAVPAHAARAADRP
ncbi:MAG: hypothetical protein LKE96_07870 [Acetobacter peroxydans]|nr:hypothetical protein [Acetobacter peroxydans]